MKNTRIERRAQKLQIATGLSWSTSLSRVKSLAAADPLIPPADEAQAELECYFLYRMAWPGIDTRNPWGIRSADSRRDALLLTVEDEDVNREVSGESMARELVRACLPRISEEGELCGIPGLRFTVEDESIRLYRIGLAGTVTLAGVDTDEWLMAIDTVTRDAESADTFLCHQQAPDRWHSSEIATRTPAAQDMYAQHHRRIIASSWLASGILRRAPLLRTIGVPLSTTAWTNPSRDGGREWIIEYIHEPLAEAPLHHRGFQNLLTDPECGIPLVVTDFDCTCQQRADAGYACRLYACSPTGSPGEIQVRFSRRLGRRLAHYTADRNDYAARRSLYQRLPESLLPVPER
ncbi:hypothetical protein OHA98_15800 [Streptomyces sp. NBC_00654]|uniref:hypothetical protein n=1 Tax=Streptomyces sp. NBC_00654 TaxID=2975799 RepID=UPI00224CBEB8|nr:hypothetical protein [Streptomyces sp. NBC_00654]MCX4966275.1 hypothetical protein [Streptomyces sp. NBC_00654]